MFYEGKGRIYVAAPALLLDEPSGIETASEWAIPHIVPNPANAWVLGRFVEADRANNNKQLFQLGDLLMSKPTISYAPLNINHSSRNVVGSFVASEMLYPADAEHSPHIEALSVFWKHYFPDEYGVVQRAHQEACLYYSMECIPAAVSTVGGTDDSALYPYEGRMSPNYPTEINERSCEAVVMHNPHFVGGALVIPPARPGWTRADVKQISKFVEGQWQQAEDIYSGVQSESPHLDPHTWEFIMGELILLREKS